jgi:hypothetical protein
MPTDPLSRFTPTSGEVVSMRAFAWRSEPPVVDEVRVCSWWWMRQRGEDGYTVPHACEIGWDEDGLFFAEPGCPRVTPEEYGDGVEWMPCIPPEIGSDDDAGLPLEIMEQGT